MKRLSRYRYTAALVTLAVVTIGLSLTWWLHVSAECDGPVVRGMWNEPVCTDGSDQ